jgi:uncharacterized protein (DUF4415 family)
MTNPKMRIGGNRSNVEKVAKTGRTPKDAKTIAGSVLTQTVVKHPKGGDGDAPRKRYYTSLEMEIRRQTTEAIARNEAAQDDDDDAPLTPEELANMRPAREVLPPSFFKAVERERNLGGRPRLERPKKQITLRLDQDVIDKYKATGDGWQSRMNEALRKGAGI